MLVATVAVVILGFTAVYSLMPGHFYQTTIRQEPEYGGRKAEFRTMLGAALERRLKELHHGGIVDVSSGHDGEPAVRRALRIRVPSARHEGAIRIKVRLLAGRSGRFDIGANIGGAKTEEQREDLCGSSDYPHLFFLTTRGAPSPNRAPSLRLRVVFGADGRYPDKGGFFCLSDDEEAQLRQFIKLEKGDPSSLANTLERIPLFLYLSVTTLSTLGFGDVVPLTPLARVLVTGEAVLGVLILGLVVNAIAGRASVVRAEPREAPPPDDGLDGASPPSVGQGGREDL